MNFPAYFDVTHIIQHARLTSLLQPIYNLATNSVLGYEALVRGPKNTLLHSPYHLFKAADEFGLTTELESLCVTKAVETFSLQNLPGKLFINVTPNYVTTQLNDSNCFIKLLKQQGVSPNRIVIELTEQSKADDLAQLKSAIARLKTFGIQFAIDDLGAGYSGLIQWSEIQPDIIKLDRHFVQNCHQQPHKQHFLRAILELANNTQALTIVEGIENQAELECIYNLGFNFAQGFYLGKPSESAPILTPNMIKSLISDNISQLIQQAEKNSQRLLN